MLPIRTRHVAYLSVAILLSLKTHTLSLMEAKLLIVRVSKFSSRKSYRRFFFCSESSCRLTRRVLPHLNILGTYTSSRSIPTNASLSTTPPLPTILIALLTFQQGFFALPSLHFSLPIACFLSHPFFHLYPMFSSYWLFVQLV